MRKRLAMLCAGWLLCFSVWAQTSVTGKVTDEQGNSIPFASILIKGKSKGITADGEGKFTFRNLPAGTVLTITSQGFKSKDVAIDSETSLNVVLEKGSDLQEVVVTSAFNIKRSQKSVASNAQNITGDQLNLIRQTNLNNALAGKIAGLQVRGQSPIALGRDANIRLRGEGSINGGGIIYVVDGTIVNSVDINPDDIQDITTLKGVNATALFGDRAVGGAIVINTKKGKKTKGIGIEINQGITFDQIYILPKYQNSYAGGASADLIRFDWKPGMPESWKTLNGKYHHDYSDDASWGPRMTGQEYIPWYAWYPDGQYFGQTAKLTPQPDNIRDFYQNGTTVNNNINFSKADKGYSIRVSYTHQNIKGLIETSELLKHNLTTNLSFDLGNSFILSSNISYVTQTLKGEFNDGYSNQSSGSFGSWFHRDLDMKKVKELRNLKSPEGYLASWNHNNPGEYLTSPLAFYGGNYWYNFYSYFDNISNVNRRDRLFGDVSLTYKLNNHFSVRGTVRKNQVTTNNENITKNILEQSATQTGVKAAYGTGQTFFSEDNVEGLMTYNNKWGDFSVNLNGGGNVRKEQAKNVTVGTVNGLNVPDLYAANNSKDPIAYGNGRTRLEVRSLFARGDIGFRDMLYAEFGVRNDWYSTLPTDNNSLLTPSFGLSFVFSELLKEEMPALSFGKLRGSWGTVPTSLAPYILGFAYGVNANQWNGNFLMTTPNRLVDPTIKGATNTAMEAGIDLRFLKNRIGFSFTYYDETRKDEPLDVQVNGASGFTTKLVNAGRVERSGIEIQVNAKPVVNKNLTWNIDVNYGQNLSNKVVELAPGISSIVVAAGAFSGTSSAYTVHEVGKEWGMLRGGGIKKINGVPILDADGFYIKEDNAAFGSVLPDFTGGIQNAVNYKNFVLNVSIDFQKGGKFFSLSDFWGTFSGLTARTAGLNDKGNPVRDAIADGGGVFVQGVDVDNKPVSKYVSAQDYYHQFRSRNISENSVYDLSYVKLREVSFGYQFPIAKWGWNKWVQQATFSLVARNLWLMYAENRDFDPSEISAVYGEDGQFPGTRSLGFNLKLGF